MKLKEENKEKQKQKIIKTISLFSELKNLLVNFNSTDNNPLKKSNIESSFQNVKYQKSKLMINLLKLKLGNPDEELIQHVKVEDNEQDEEKKENDSTYTSTTDSILNNLELNEGSMSTKTIINITKIINKEKQKKMEVEKEEEAEEEKERKKEKENDPASNKPSKLKPPFIIEKKPSQQLQILKDIFFKNYSVISNLSKEKKLEIFIKLKIKINHDTTKDELFKPFSTIKVKKIINCYEALNILIKKKYCFCELCRYLLNETHPSEMKKMNEYVVEDEFSHKKIALSSELSLEEWINLVKYEIEQTDGYFNSKRNILDGISTDYNNFTRIFERYSNYKKEASRQYIRQKFLSSNNPDLIEKRRINNELENKIKLLKEKVVKLQECNKYTTPWNNLKTNSTYCTISNLEKQNTENTFNSFCTIKTEKSYDFNNESIKILENKTLKFLSSILS